MEAARPQLERIFLSAYESHADAIFRYCYFKLSDRDAAQDALQEVFMRLWKYLQGGKVVTEVQAFLFVVASNYIKDQWRKKKAVPLSIFDSPEDGTPLEIPDEEDKSIEGIEYRLALELFRTLPDDERMLLQLRFVEDMAVKDIAVMFGERENTIAVRLSRSLARLRKAYMKKP